MTERAGLFLKNAGTVILAISIVLWLLAAYPKSPAGATATEQLAHSFAGRAGHLLEPVIKPIGFDWHIGIGLISSFAAREVFVSTMGVVFSAESGGEDTTSLRHALNAARWPDGRVLFTIAVVRRETNSWRWPLFQTAYMTGAAWIICFIVYQSGTALGF
jgi:ferrous iron transport protein B